MHGVEPVQQLLMLGFLPEEADMSVWADFGTLTNKKVRARCAAWARSRGLRRAAPHAAEPQLLS
eukprot:6231222-Prymnesium_polylepis.2